MTADASALMKTLPPPMADAAAGAARRISGCSDAVVATHIDADGIAAASIASGTLRRLGIRHEVMFFKKLDDAAISSLYGSDADLVWFTDLGSGSVSKLGALPTVVTDHHVPDSASPHRVTNGQATLSEFAPVHHVNPHLHGISGATDLSGAGATFLAAVAVDEDNAEFAGMAVLGAVGDLQDQRTRRLEGLNRSVLSLACDKGIVVAQEDIRFFGRETRPIYKMLEYSSDPYLPGITGKEQEAISFILSLGVELKDGDSWRTWATLSGDERERVIAALRDHLEMRGRKSATVERLTGEVYSLAHEEHGSPVRDVKEFATLLNACGRHGRAPVGLAICSGDRNGQLAEGYSLLRDHRSALSQALDVARHKGVHRMTHIQYFDAGDEIEETIVGTVAGMLLGSNGADRTAPIIAFADSLEPTDEPMVKVSSRGNQDLVAKGLDLSAAMREVAGSVGGVGGGHNIAAGATIPTARKRDFLAHLDEVVGSQLRA